MGAALAANRVDMIAFATAWTLVFMIIILVSWHRALHNAQFPDVARVLAGIWMDALVLTIVCGPVWIYAFNS